MESPVLYPLQVQEAAVRAGREAFTLRTQGLSTSSALKSRSDNAGVMLTITRQSQPVTQILLALRECFLCQGAGFGPAWVRWAVCTAPGVPCPLGTCSCRAMSWSRGDLSPSCSAVCRITSWVDFHRLWPKSFSDWCTLSRGLSTRGSFTALIIGASWKALAAFWLCLLPTGTGRKGDAF